MTKHDPRLDALDAAATEAEPVAHADTEARERRLVARLLVGTLAGVALWGGAIAAFGWPALILPALALVPAIFLWLFLITWG